MQTLINQSNNQHKRSKNSSVHPATECSGNNRVRTHAISGIKHDFHWAQAGSARAPSAWIWTSHCPIDAMRRLASQPRNVRYGTPRRMRGQHQTKMTVRVRKSNRGMKQQSINQSTKQNNKSRVPGAEFQKNSIKFQFKFKLNLNQIQIKFKSNSN